MTVPHPSRPLRSAAAAAVAGLALGGCSMFSPQTTQNIAYAPSDGVQGEAGELAVRNVFVLTEEEGASADVVGALFNASDEQVSVEVVVREPLAGDDVEPQDDLIARERIEVGANDSVYLGPDADEQVRIEELDVVPGRAVEVIFVAESGELVLRAPVLDGTLEQYAELLDADEEQG